MNKGKLNITERLPEKKIVLAAFGAGFTWGSVMINW